MDIALAEKKWTPCLCRMPKGSRPFHVKVGASFAVFAFRFTA
jgi:hypothetical protein